LKQGFSPEVVRLFLSETGIGRRPGRGRPVLDPFAGSGTCVVECARRNVPAIGVEVLESLIFLNELKAARELPPLTELGQPTEWESVAATLSVPIHRAALMLAVSRRYTSEGKPNRGAPPLFKVLAEVFAMMSHDLVFPLPRLNPIRRGDARTLEGVESESVEGILTSPPYLSRHDYARITQPIEQVYRFWYGADEPADPRVTQIRAHPRARWRPPAVGDLPAGAIEASAWMAQIGEPKLAAVVAGYFEDMGAVLAAWTRVLKPGGVWWMVVGGARLKGVYVPSDLILAELAEAHGLQVNEIRAARDLIDARRKFGSIGRLAPRESILIGRKR
jgi:hypothetical protein